MQIHTKAIISLSILFSINTFSQEKVLDSTKATNIEEVVITGQFEPQSLSRAVNSVQVITREDIMRQAANNLADVLNQYLNISIQQNNGEGRSTISMFGLDGQYFKIMVDNIPLVSDTGLGNNIDVNQINLDDVEQIEIIEGSMGVTHGANAVSGIINIITRKNSKHAWEITATAQEETVGEEYSAFKNEGRHIQSLRVAHTVSDKWFVALGANRNDFGGFLDQRGGIDKLTNEPTAPEKARGFSWLPKEQIFSNALIRYQAKNFRLFYKFDYFDESLDYYNPISSNEIVDGAIQRLARDRHYATEKFFHHLNGSGKLFSQIDFNISLSHQQQNRDVENFKYYIQSGQEAANATERYQSTEVLYSTGTFSNFFDNKTIDMQLGYEFVNTNGYSSALAGMFNDPDQQGVDKKQRLENYDVFASAEINLTDRFLIRPGIRVSAQSKFDDQYASSLGLRYLFNKGYEARVSYGQSYRTPNYEELYTYFVDSNHYVVGNDELIPETSTSIEASVKKTTFFDSGLQLSNSVMGNYMDVDDRIELALINTVPMWQYQYINIDKYKMWNVSTSHQLKYNNWQAKVGFSLLGVSRKMNTGQITSDDKFLNTFQLNTNISYTVPKWNTMFSAYYKLNGKQQQFLESVDADGNAVFLLNEIESFGWLEASVRKSFFANRLEATVGARNILDVVNINSSQASTGAHSVSSTDITMGYGRSYFLKLTYNLNF
jgi:outer membrane receptor for ferrienterochelin and colicins